MISTQSLHTDVTFSTHRAINYHRMLPFGNIAILVLYEDVKWIGQNVTVW